LQSCVLRRIVPPHALPNQYRSPQHHRDQRLPSLCRSPLYRLDRDLRPNLSQSPPQRTHPFHPKRITSLTRSRRSSNGQLRWRQGRRALRTDHGARTPAALAGSMRAKRLHPSRIVQIQRDPQETAFLARDTKSGLVVMRHEDSKRLKELCEWFGWQVLDGGMPGAGD
jgi:hypothetical protein